MLTVEPLRFKGVWQAGKNHRHLSRLCGGNRLAQQRFIKLISLCVEAFGIDNVRFACTASKAPSTW